MGGPSLQGNTGMGQAVLAWEPESVRTDPYKWPARLREGKKNGTPQPLFPWIQPQHIPVPLTYIPTLINKSHIIQVLFKLFCMCWVSD